MQTNTRFTMLKDGIYLYEGQDYAKLKKECRKSGTLFKDSVFPATRKSYSRKVRKIQWSRPRKICNDPRFFVDGAKRFDVNQGKLGDCWLLAGKLFI